MATQIIEFRSPTGLTLTAKLFGVGNDSQVASVSATEEANRKGTYRATYQDVAAGEYLIIAMDGSSIPVASFWVTLSLTSETFQVYDRVFGVRAIAVSPLLQTNAQRALPAYVETYQHSKATLGPFRIEDSEGNQFDLASQTDWIVVVWDKDDTALGTVPYADIDFTSSTSNAVMDQYSFAPIAAQVATAGRHYFSLRRPQGTDEQVATSGVFNVIKAPRGASA